MAALSFDDLIPKPSPDDAAQKQPQLLSDEDVFGAAPPRAERKTAAAGLLSDADVFGGDTSLTDYPVAFGKGVVQGVKSFPAGALKGTGAILATAPEKFTRDTLAVLDRIDAGEKVPETEDVIGYRHMSPELRKQTRDEIAAIASRPDADVTQNPLYRAGSAIDTFGQDTFLAPRPGFEPGKSWTHDIGAGFGSVASAIAANLALGPVASGAMFTLAGSGEAADNAIKAKATNEQIRQAASLGTVPGATDALDALLPTLGTTGKALGFIKRVGLAAVGGALVEGGQEGVQQLMQNAIQKGLYNPDLDWMDDVPRSAAIGAIVGAAVSGGTSAAERHARVPAAEPMATDRDNRAPPGAPPGAVPADMLVTPAESAPAAPEAAAQTTAAPIPAHGTLQRAVESGQAAMAEAAGATPVLPASEVAAQATPPFGQDVSRETPPQPGSREGTAEVYAPAAADVGGEQITQPTGTAGAPIGAMETTGETAPLSTGEGTREAPVKVTSAEDIARAAAAAATDYSPAQGEANNRQLGHARWNGLDASIEVAGGDVRRGVNSTTGEPTQTTFTAPYGYWKGTKGADKMPVDAYFGPNIDDPTLPAYVLDEINPSTGKFRQHKTFVGFSSPDAAAQAYLGTSTKTPDMIGGVTAMPVDAFKAWLADESKTSRQLSEATPSVDIKVNTPKPRRKGPLSLLQFIAQNGGIDPRDPLIADVRSALGTTNKFIPGFGMLIRPTGKALDNLREAAAEAGYLHDAGAASGGVTASSINDLLDALSNEERGQRLYAPHDVAEIQDREDAKRADEAAARLEDTAAEIRDLAKTHGFNATDAQVQEAARASLVNGTDPIDALVDVLEHDAIAEHDILTETAKRQGATDGEARPTAADENGARPAPTVQPARPSDQAPTGSAPPRVEPGQDQRGRVEPRAEAAEGTGSTEGDRGTEAASPTESASAAEAVAPPPEKAARPQTTKAPETGPSDSVAIPSRRVASEEPMFALRPTEGPRAHGIPVGASAPIATFRNDRPLKAHPDYKAAKAGDKEAAARLVEALVTPENLASAREKFGTDVIYAPVIAEEMTGHNAIPALLATYYAQRAGGRVTADIQQSNLAHHTGAKPMERLAVRAEFAGRVDVGARYVLVDDVSVMGSTLAEMANHIRTNGGEVAGVVVLVNASRSGVLSPTRARVSAVERRFGDAIRDTFGIEPSGLTADEADYILNFPTVDALRSRSVAALGERADRLRAKGVRQDASGQVTPTEKSNNDSGAPPGAVSDSGPKFALREATTAPPFYSAVMRAVENVKLAKAPAIQWLNTLRNVPGVTPEEMQWLGLDGWLKEQQGAVTRDAVLDYVRANQVEVKEVEKGGPLNATIDEQAALEDAVLEAANDAGIQEHQADALVGGALRGDAQAIGDLEGLGIEDSLLAPFRDRGRAPTKYSSYVLPGGENYRELLLTLPGSMEQAAQTDRATQARRAEVDALAEFKAASEEFGVDSAQAEAARAAWSAAVQRSMDAERPVKVRFQSPHWPEPNVLAHVRFNDRVIDGKKTLFIEEVQSDWHQRGKKGGYIAPFVETKQADLVEPRQLVSADNPGMNGLAKWEFRNSRSGATAYGWGETEADARADAVKWANSDIRREGRAGAVPDAPFKTTWPELALKRMIRFAAENGYDKIAWAPGEVQADRYDLSKQVNRIGWARRKDGTYDLTIDMGDNRPAIIRDKQTAQQLENLIGKDPVERIEADAGEKSPVKEYTAVGELKGEGLKVGGEGMKGFYDKILPAAVNKLVKKFGAKVEQSKLEFQPIDVLKENGWQSADTSTQRPPPANTVPVHSVDLTPALREAATQQGFPLFKAGDKQRGLGRPSEALQGVPAYELRTPYTAEFQEHGARVGPLLRAELDRMGLRHIPLHLPDRINLWIRGRHSGADGIYWKRAITLALEGGNTFKTLHHEALHALRDLGLFTKAEWGLLERQSQAKWRDQYEIDRFYAQASERVKTEEGITHAYAEWAAGNSKVDGRFVRLFKRIRSFLQALGNALRGAGFKTVEDIFRDIKGGAIGSRSNVRHQGREPLLAARRDDSDLFKTEVVQTPDGPREQGVIPGAEKISEKERVQREANKPLKPRKIQKDVDGLPLFNDEPAPDLPMFALKQEPETAGDRQRVSQGFMARGQFIDRAIRMPFDIFGGITRDGEWKPGHKLFESAAKIITGAKFSPEGRFSFLNPIMETARSGLVDRYNLRDMPDYVERERARALDERAVMLQGAEILKGLKHHAVGPAEAKVLQAILTGEDVSAGDMAKLAAPIREAVDQLGQEAVDLGLVSAESFERNRGTYLHRVYQKYEAEQNGLARMVSSIMRARRKKIIGDQFRGRGLFTEIELRRLMRDVPDWHEGARGKPENGEKFVRLDEMAPQQQLALDENKTPEKVLRTVYLPADRAIPDRYSGFRNQGIWEVRGTKNGKIVLWRDFTKAERESMGEILDARYTIGKTFSLMAHDLSVGKFYKDIATNEAWTLNATPNAKWVDAGEWSAQGRRLKGPGDIEWVRVPELEIPNSGGKKRWGALAGKWIREPIWRDLNEMEIMNRPSTWRSLLTQWKLNKALALDTPIPTPSGWTTMGAIRVGDKVFDETGAICEVLEVKDVQHGRPCYEVAFSDGTKIVADEDHFWFTIKRNHGGGVRTTKEILDTLKERTRGDRNHSIPVAAPLALPPVDLPLPPYALGLWLGDGHSRSPRITVGDRAFDEIKSHLADDGIFCSPRSRDKRSSAVTFTIGTQPIARNARPNLLKNKLKSLGVFGAKHLPDLYLRSSADQRRALLQGLMDSDGWITKKGTCGFATSMPRLRDGTLELLRSLGFKPTIAEHLAPSGKPAWRIHFQAYSGTEIFRLRSKASRLRKQPASLQRSSTRQVISITPVPSVPVRCIAVSSASHLYLAGAGMIPTHNTARSPVVHMNNVMSNFVLMDMMDVRMQDLVQGIRSFASGDTHYKEAFENGAFGADMITQEVRDQVLKPILDELQKGNTFQQGGRLGLLGQISKLTELLHSKYKAGDQFLKDAYRIEDEVFRMATYIRRRALGDDPKQAATVAREQFIDYDIRAPWINAARNTVLPFISYTYRAVPLVAKAVATRPWKLAKYAALAYIANALAYAVTGGDEDRERRSLREQEQGLTWIGANRMTRMPTNDRYGNPLFLDIRRWMPAGDVFDFNQGQSPLPIPSFLNMGGPLLLGAELFLNKQAFTGQPITNEKTDTALDKAGKVADWAYKSWMPSAAYIPGSWYWEKIANAAKGATDRQGRPYDIGTAVASSVGIKLKPQDVDDAFALKGMEFRRIELELRTEARRLADRSARHIISEAEYNRGINAIMQKLERLGEKRAETFKD